MIHGSSGEKTTKNKVGMVRMGREFPEIDAADLADAPEGEGERGRGGGLLLISLSSDVLHPRGVTFPSLLS